jgi:hypothetical protein
MGNLGTPQEPIKKKIQEMPAVFNQRTRMGQCSYTENF